MSTASLAGVFECVVNVSEGRDRETIGLLWSTAGSTLLDVHSDPDHHRSVLTLAGRLDDVEAGVRRIALTCVEQLDLRQHQGVHPRLGALDVVPFVAFDPAGRTSAIAAAKRFAVWLADTLDVPAFLYDDAADDGVALPQVRAEAFRIRAPDHGPTRPHPTMGATAVGARRPLVAVNCILDRQDLSLARWIAATIRERDGGLPGVRALGLPLTRREATQVAMNLVDLDRTGIETACAEVRARARSHGADVVEVELVGLLPRQELDRSSEAFRAWAGLGSPDTIEARFEATRDQETRREM